MSYGRILVVEVWGRPPGPNSRRQHFAVAKDNATWSEKAQIAAIEAMARTEAHGLKLWPREQVREAGHTPRSKRFIPALHRSTAPMERALSEIEFVLNDERDRDADNLIAATKPLMDGCVRAGVVVDDSLQRLVERRFKFSWQEGVRMTRLKFAEVLA